MIRGRAVSNKLKFGVYLQLELGLYPLSLRLPHACPKLPRSPIARPPLTFTPGNATDTRHGCGRRQLPRPCFPPSHSVSLPPRAARRAAAHYALGDALSSNLSTASTMVTSAAWSRSSRHRVPLPARVPALPVRAACMRALCGIHGCLREFRRGG